MTDTRVEILTDRIRLFSTKATEYAMVSSPYAEDCLAIVEESKAELKAMTATQDVLANMIKERK